MDPLEARSSIDPLGQVQLRTLVLIRWIAIGGQAGTLIVVHSGFGFTFPLLGALAIVGASAILNMAVVFAYPAGALLRHRAASMYLAFDILQLSALLYLTGGLHNPFVVLLLAPCMVSATVLPRRSTMQICLLAIVCVSILAISHAPLPWRGPPPSFPAELASAIWAALVLSIVFIAAYVSRVAAEQRDLGDALAATQLALAREQRVSALGALAAAAAHELGTPLATIAVVAGELAREVPPESPLASDAALLLSQTARCREILAELARRPETEGGDPFDRLSLPALVEEAAATHSRPGVEIEIEERPDEEFHGEPPTVARSPEAMHGLANLIANAVDFARRRVTLTVSWSAADATVQVADDGPGFAAHLSGRLGEPYLTERRDGGGHMGLGIFIAQTLLTRTGATLEFGARRNGGALITIHWNRTALDRWKGTP